MASDRSRGRQRKLISRSAFREFLAPYSRGLPGEPPFDYGLGVLRGGGWFFGNPEVNGYFGILGHDLGGNTSIVVDNTNGPNMPEGKNINGIVFSKLTDYLTPDHPFKK